MKQIIYMRYNMLKYLAFDTDAQKYPPLICYQHFTKASDIYIYDGNGCLRMKTNCTYSTSWSLHEKRTWKTRWWPKPGSVVD